MIHTVFGLDIQHEVKLADGERNSMIMLLLASSMAVFFLAYFQFVFILPSLSSCWWSRALTAHLLP